MAVIKVCTLCLGVDTDDIHTIFYTIHTLII